MPDKASKELLKFLDNQTELEACAQNPAYFMTKYVFIQNRNTGQKVKWEAWDYLVGLLRDFALHKEIVILKARQLGLTWLGAGYCLWKTLFGENIMVLFLSKDKDAAIDLISKVHFIWENLPDFMRLSLKNDSLALMTFNTNHSELRALASTIDAGRATDATVVWRDELAHHQYAKENFAAIGPTVDSGGQLIDISTINKLDPTSHFTERVNKARNGESNAHFAFLGWRLRPVREPGMTQDDWFNENIRRKYSSFEIEQEYPETLEDAIKVTGVQSFFNEQLLNNMLLDCCEPLDMGGAFDTLNGMIKIYKLPVPGGRYVVFTDPSDGVSDPHATIVLDWQTGEQVAESHGKIVVELCAEIHDKLVRFYNNNAFNSYDVCANSGGTFQNVLKNLGTPNIAPRRKPEGEIVNDKWGLFITESHKKIISDGLDEACRNHRIRFHNRAIISEFKNIIRVETGMPKPIRGAHDDYFMAAAGVWYTKQYMPIHEARVISIQYKQRWGS